MPDRLLNTEFWQTITKIIFPAFLAVGVKIAIEMKKNKNKVTALNVFLSMIIGVTGAYLASDWVQESFSDKYISVVIAAIAILSDRIGEFLIYKMDIDKRLTPIIDVFFPIKNNNENKL